MTYPAAQLLRADPDNVTVHVPLFREVFSRRMRGNPEGITRETA